jgi:hypothetical protein
MPREMQGKRGVVQGEAKRRIQDTFLITFGKAARTALTFEPKRCPIPRGTWRQWWGKQ